MGVIYRTRYVVLLLLALAALAMVQPSEAALNLTWHVHVVNGLSNGALTVHCKSKDDDLGEHNLAQRGAEVQWSFEENIWGTTLFWCFVQKPGASVSFEVFWHEARHLWLVTLCKDKICIWTAKDEGIYLKNIPKNADEFVHKWA